jgi:hypothetical protein
MIRNPRDLDRRAPVHQHELGLRAREWTIIPRW